MMSREMKEESCRSRITPDANILGPESDGYWSSSVTSVSSPLEPKLFRYSQSSDSHGSISRQGSIRSDAGPNITVNNSDEVSLKSNVKPRSSTTGDEENINSVRKADTVDPTPTDNSKPTESTLQPPTTPTGWFRNVKETLAPVSEESNEYNMSYEKRGVAIIFNHKNFQGNHSEERLGTNKDVESLESLYNLLGFEVRIYNDLTAQQIYDELVKLAQEDHKDRDCVCVTVLTHGSKGGLNAYDRSYKYHNFYNIFSATNCLSLAGKPKIFIFQACRGKKKDVGVRLVDGTCCDSGASTQSSSYTIPNMVDFLIAHSTFHGYYSWRNPNVGTWYIQSLVRILKEQHETVDLLTMMTRVTHYVATQHESLHLTRPDQRGLKQAPSFCSTLMRQIYFKPKASKRSLSSQHQVSNRNTNVIEAAKSTRNDADAMRKREELRRRIEETRKQLQTVGFKSKLKNSQSIQDLSIARQGGGKALRPHVPDPGNSGFLTPHTMPRYASNKSSPSSMVRSSSVGILNQSDSEGEGRLSRVMRPTISSQNKIQAKNNTSNQLSRRLRHHQHSHSTMNLSREAGHTEDSSSEENQVTPETSKPVPPPRPKSCVGLPTGSPGRRGTDLRRSASAIVRPKSAAVVASVGTELATAADAVAQLHRRLAAATASDGTEADHILSGLTAAIARAQTLLHDL